MLETLKQWDRDLFVFLNSLGTDGYDGFWIFVTQVQSWIPLFILFVILIFYYYRGRKAGSVVFFLLLTVGITLVFTGMIKEYVRSEERRVGKECSYGLWWLHCKV